jgi:hypothetical protein
MGLPGTVRQTALVPARVLRLARILRQPNDACCVSYVEEDDVKPGLEEECLYSASFYPDSGGFSLVVAWFSLEG